MFNLINVSSTDVLFSLTNEQELSFLFTGSYDAQKYNGDYTHHNAANIAHNGAQLSQFGKRPESDASASGSFINQNNQAVTDRFGSQTTQGQVNPENPFGFNTQHHGFSGSQGSQSHGVSTGHSNGQLGHQSQFGLTNNFNGQASQFGTLTQSTRPSGSQFGSQTQSTQQSGSYGSHAQSSQPSGSQFEATQPSGPLGSPFVSQFQSSQHFGSQLGIHAQSTRPSGSQFGPQSQPSQQTGLQFGAQAQSSQQTGSQFGAQAQFSQQSGAQFGVHAQSTHPFRPQFGNQPQFGFQSNFQTKPQPDALKPTDAAASSSFSQSSVTPSPVSPGNQFNGQNGNKPFNAFGSNQFSAQNQYNQYGTSSPSNINRFPQPPNQFATNNEYLPPSNNFGTKPQFGATNTFNNGLNQNRPSQGFDSQTQTQEFQQSSGFATSSKPNNFQSQTPPRPSKFSGNFQSSQNQQFNSQSTPSQSSLNSQTISNLKPTSIPDTELTTPLEPNEVSTSSQSEYTSQTTTNLGSTLPSFSGSKPYSASNLGSSTNISGVPTSSFGGTASDVGSSSTTFESSKPSFGSSISSVNGFDKQPSNQFSQVQQFNTQGNLGSNSQTFPSTAPAPRPQTSSFQFGGSFNKPSNNGRPQFPQNSFGQNQLNQKPDDSYYYNRPSKPFNTPQDSRFPSSPSYQSNIGQNTQFESQQKSSTKVPGTPVLSTSVTQFTQNQGSSTNFNGITQAAISPFPSISPTSSTQFDTTQYNQFGSKPTFSQTSFSQSQPSTDRPNTSLPLRPQFDQKPTVSQSQTTQNGLSNFQTDSQNQPTVQNQQYEGTIYEYNKPAETLPSTQSDSDSSQTIQSNTVSSKPEENKPTTSQISPKPTQASQFGQNSFIQSQQPNFNQGVSRSQFGLQSNNVPNRFDQTTQFGGQASSQQQSSQASTPSSTGSSQTNFAQGPIGLGQQPLGTTGSGYLGYPSAQDSKPQFGSNFGEISQFPTVGQSQSNFNSQGQKPNKQNLGFNSKPQFSQDSQSAQTSAYPSELVNAFQNPYQQQASQTQASPQNQPSLPQQNTQFGFQNKPNKVDQSSLVSDSQPFSNMAVLSAVPSPPSKTFLPQTSAQAAVSAVPLDFIPLHKPQNQFNQPSSPQPVKSTPSSQFGSQYSSFQSSTSQGVSGKGEEFGGPRPPPSFDDKTGYYY